jgi:hypothetical protein
VTARVPCSVQSLCHQYWDLHQSTYLYLLKDRDSTSHYVSRSSSLLPHKVLLCPTRRMMLAPKMQAPTPMLPGITPACSGYMHPEHLIGGYDRSGAPLAPLQVVVWPHAPHAPLLRSRRSRPLRRRWHIHLLGYVGQHRVDLDLGHPLRWAPRDCLVSCKLTPSFMSSSKAILALATIVTRWKAWPTTCMHWVRPLPIASVGDTTLTGPFYLNNILVAPDIIENLLFVPRFTTDNWCNILRPLYTLWLPSHLVVAAPMALVASAYTWHRHLGHPGIDVLSKLSNSIYFFSRLIYTILSSQPLILTFCKWVLRFFRNPPAVQIASGVAFLQMSPYII